MASLVRAADTQNFDAVVHDLGSLGLYTTVSRLVSGYRPDAVVLIRWTPDGRSLEVLRRTSVPVVLIHADRLQYPAPVIANIVPAQERLVPYVYKWAKGVLEKARPREGRGYDERIVMAAMPDEAPVWEFPPIPGVTPAIRNHRKELIREALQGLPSEWVEVPDYSFRHALTVWRRFPTAAGYLCLSDELAVGVKHLLVATGDVTSGRLVGFDDGPLASADDLTSFGQRIDEIGPAAMELLRAWFNAASRGGVRFSPAQEIPTGFHLAERD
jgi:DNA-binding LacI/PurR family transcriptional regulator